MCVTYCPQDYKSDYSTRTCRHLLKCPLLKNKGSDFHVENVRGIILDNEKKTLISFAAEPNIKLWNYDEGYILTTL